jgi:hypothetical protein
LILVGCGLWVVEAHGGCSLVIGFVIEKLAGLVWDGEIEMVSW